ncbi:MAG TPA: hypothetical protein VMU87_18190 [Stellaceae bacterium]|nr:hypothetical protein [Stellaceae bacterium]
MNGRREDGFVLVTVIWFVALIALAATIISGWVSESVDRASALKDRIAGERALISATNQVAYLLTTSYFTSQGLVHVDAADAGVAVHPMGFTPSKHAHIMMLDGRPYRFGTGIVELQDTKGLYNLASINPYTFEHLLEYFGISSQEGRGLLDKLLDYESVNTTLKRLNGANVNDYVRAGQPPPRSARLITPWEPYRVLGWAGYPALWRGPVAFADLTTVTPDTQGLNPNTAPAALLRSLPGLDQNAVDKLLKYREVQPITTLAEMDDLTGLIVPIGDSTISPFPANSLRATFAFPQDPLARVVGFTLLPVGKTPFRIDYVVDEPQEPPLRSALATAKLPQFPDFAPAP